MKRRGIEMRMVLEDDCKPSRFDRPLIKAVARARRWSNQVLSRQVPSVRAIARQERIGPRYVRDLLPLGPSVPAYALCRRSHWGETTWPMHLASKHFCGQVRRERRWGFE